MQFPMTFCWNSPWIILCSYLISQFTGHIFTSSLPSTALKWCHLPCSSLKFVFSSPQNEQPPLLRKQAEAGMSFGFQVISPKPWNPSQKHLEGEMKLYCPAALLQCPRARQEFGMRLRISIRDQICRKFDLAMNTGWRLPKKTPPLFYKLSLPVPIT